MNSKMLAGRKIAVFDAEIKKPIEQCSKGWQSHDEMGVSVLVIYDYASERYRIFNDKNAAEACAILSTYDLVVGFNTVGFDWKLLKASWPGIFPVKMDSIPHGALVQADGRLSRDYDILREIWLSLYLNPDRFEPRTHGGYKLDDVAFETIQMRKTANGALAPIMYQKGEYAALIDYCIEDVRIERTLFEFVVDHGYVVRNGRVINLAFPFPQI